MFDFLRPSSERKNWTEYELLRQSDFTDQTLISEEDFSVFSDPSVDPDIIYNFDVTKYYF